VKLKPKVKKDREATQEELKCIKETEEMLKKEQKLPPTSQMIRNIATDHWKSLKAWVKGSQVIAPQEIAEKRWEICKQCPQLLYDETNPDTGKKDGRCVECGCFMNIKVHYAVAECPIDKWTAECKCNQREDCKDK
tara:strand:+ start:203 stop:610 length:408 start_codon:yes stop_codon:yes gene_type:complete